MGEPTFDANDIDVLGKFKNKKRAVEQYRKTSGFLSKISLFLGLLLLIVFIVLKIVSFMGPDAAMYDVANSNVPGIAISFSVILIAVAIIMYFFDYQFSKLEKIIEEVESGKGPIFEDEED